MDDWIKAAARELAEIAGSLAITHDAPGEDYIATVIASHYSAAQWRGTAILADRAKDIAELKSTLAATLAVENAILKRG